MNVLVTGFALLAAISGASPAPTGNESPRGTQDRGGTEVSWVNPPAEQMPGVTHATFPSALMKSDVGFNIYLPPDYATSRKRYPVVYFLHGAPANENQLLKFTPMLDQGIRSGEVPPMIMVLPNGGGMSFYCDSVDGTLKVESMIIRELIPFVDSHYRTVASRHGRAIQGWSMGGFGALKLGFQYPELFGCVVAIAPALVTPESYAARSPAWYQKMFGGKPELLNAVHPETLAKKNAHRIRGSLPIRLAVGGEESHLDRMSAFHQLLDDLKIQNVYEVHDGLGHQSGPASQAEGVKPYKFIARELNLGKATPAAR